jgi:hypothetical protein
MSPVEKLLQHEWHTRLKAQGVPIHADKRTPEQEATAYMELWSVRSGLLLDAGSITQAALEVQ